MEFAYILIGWALGLFSPSIVKKISERGERRNLNKIIYNDLKDLKKRLAPLSYRVLPKYGKLDEEVLGWLKNNSGAEFSKGIMEVLENGSSMSQLLTYLNSKGVEESTSVYFKKMHLFATDSHLIRFGLIDDSLMEKLLEIKFHIEAFNEEVDNLRTHLKMTFQPGISTTNHDLISKQIENTSLWLAKQSILIVDKINCILEPEPPEEDRIAT